MIRYISSLLLSLSIASQADLVSLTFANGNTLPGTPLKYETNKLDWISDILANPTTLDTSELLNWYKKTNTPSLSSDHTAHVEFNKGGKVIGKLTAITVDQITLETNYMGIIRIPRAMVRSLNIEEERNTLYLGPGLLSDWIIHDKNSWKNDSTGITSNQSGSISREVPFPKDQFRINFSLQWKNNPRFHLHFLTDDHTQAYSNSNFSLSFNNGRTITLTKNYIDDDGEIRAIQFPQAVRILRLIEQGNAKFELFVDRISGTFHLYNDDNLLQSWRDPNPESGTFGKGLQLTSDDNYINLDSLSVSEWDGSIPIDLRIKGFPPPLSEEETAKGYQLIHLRNGDYITAKVKSIDKNIALVETPFTEVEIPLSRMKTVALRPLKESEYDEAIRMKGDVTGYFLNGTQLTFRLDSFKGMQAKIYSQNFGAAEIDLSVFTHIDFNIYRERFRMLR